MVEQNNRDLTKLFNPDSIAIVGASRDEKKLGHIVLKNIIASGFKGKIFPINPNCESVDGLTCYPDYQTLPQTPDLAIMAVPAEVAVSLLESVAKQGTKNIVVLSSGFKETGAAGKELEEKLKVLAEKYKLNILGPNCLGFVNNPLRLNATFSQAESKPGNLRFISQSGALASAIFDWAKQKQVFFSEFITLGNKAVIDEGDILNYWTKQSLTQASEKESSGYRPVGMYLESIGRGREFLRLVKKISTHDPVFVLKAGRSQAAQKAIQSHTGSLANDDAVLGAALAEAGIIRCDGVEDFLDLTQVFSWQPAPDGPNVAIVSNAGGPAVISVDTIQADDLQLANFTSETRTKLAGNLPSAASVLNPVDVLGDALADRYAAAIDSVLADKNTHALIVILTPQVMTPVEATAEVIGKLAKKYKKPVVCSFMGGATIDQAEKALNSYKIPSFRFPERAILALSKMWQWRAKVESFTTAARRGPAEAGKVKSSLETKSFSKNIISKINQIIKLAKDQNRQVLSGTEADKILNLAGIKTPKSMEVKSFKDAEKFARINGWPVVLKISSAEMIHKTEAGGVITNITDRKQLELAWKKISQTASRLPRKSLSAIQIQKQIISGMEVIVGVKHDANFGNVMLFGAGGVLAELIADKNLKLLPMNGEDAEKLIERSKVGRVMAGFRGHKPYAIKKLAGMIVKLGELAELAPIFSEITINPVIVTETDVWAVDARLILKN